MAGHYSGRTTSFASLVVFLCQTYAAAQEPTNVAIAPALAAANPSATYAETRASDLFSGSLRYSVPLEVPRGRGGARPALIMSYNSQATDRTEIGTKWLLELPAIERDRTNGLDYAADEYTFRTGFQYSRLSSQGGGLYREIIDTGSYFEFHQKKTADESIAWELVAKGGEVYSFGGTKNSRLEGPNGTAIWYVDSIRDVNGNQIAYEYDDTSENPRISRIYYGRSREYNYDKRIEFRYTLLANSVDTYKWGFQTTLEHQLNSIAVVAHLNPSDPRNSGGVEVENWQLRYTNDPQMPGQQLAEVWRSTGALSQRLHNFTYTETPKTPDVIEEPITQQLPEAQYVGVTWLAHAKRGSIRFVDVNGDGAVDVCGRTSGGYRCSLASKRRVATRDYEGFFVRHISISDGQFSDGNVGSRPVPNCREWQEGDIRYTECEWGGSPTVRLDYSVTFLDLDADGKVDTCGLNKDGLVCAVGDRLVRGPHLFTQRQWWRPDHYQSFRAGDIDGDGSDELCALIEASFRCFGLDTDPANAELREVASTSVLAPSYWRTSQYMSTLRLFDANGDGRADLCGRDKDGFKCWRSSGKSFDLVEFALGSLDDRYVQDSQVANIHIVDLNGDSKVDVCALLSRFMCWINTGQSFKPIERIPSLLASEFSERKFYQSVRMGDIDGNRLVDLCARREESLVCWKFDGIGFGEAITVAENIGNVLDAEAAYPTILDINSDAMSEYCYTMTSGLKCHGLTGQPAGLMTTIGNQFGGTSIIEYDHIHDAAARIPFPLYTVNKIVSNDRYDYRSVVFISYHGGYFSKKANDFRGFRAATQQTHFVLPLREQTEESLVLRKSTSRTQFHQGDGVGDRDAAFAYLKGRPESVTWEGDGGHRQIEYQYTIPTLEMLEAKHMFSPVAAELQTLCDGIGCEKPKRQSQATIAIAPPIYDSPPWVDPGSSVPSPLFPTLFNEVGRSTPDVAFRALDSEAGGEFDEALYQHRLNEWRRRLVTFRTAYRYDEWGNTTEIKAEHDTKTDEDDIRITFQYALFSDASIRNRIERETWYDGVSGNASKIRQISFRYDEYPFVDSIVAGCSELLADGQLGNYPQRGNITSIVYWLDRTDRASLQADVVTQYAYDDAGNVRCQKDPLGGVWSIDMDSSALYPRFFRNPLGHTTIVEIHGVTGISGFGRYGRVAKVTDVNNQEWVLEYDDLGRFSRSTDPTGSVSSVDYIMEENGTLKGLRTTRGNVWVEEAIDGYGRIRTSRKQSDSKTYAYQRVEFDDRGYRIAWSVPVVFPHEQIGKEDTKSLAWSRRSYDGLGRLLYAAAPTGETSTNCYEDFTRYTYDKNNVNTVSKLDSRYRIVETKIIAPHYRKPPALSPPNPFETLGCVHGSPDPTTVSKISYEYSALSQLKETKINDMPIFQMKLDSLGRVISINDAVRGKTEFRDFDGAGNPLTIDLPTGARVRKQYDLLGRLLNERIGDDEKLSFRYDIASRNGIGRLARVDQKTSRESFDYDSAGRIKGFERVIDGRHFPFAYNYDDMGRLHSRTFPNSETLVYQYDGDMLSGIEIDGRKIVGFDNWLGTGDPTTVALADTATLELAYGGIGERCPTPNFQLCSLKAARNTGDAVVEVEYEYSAVGDIVRIIDAEETETTFRYDPWRRLDEASVLVKGENKATVRTYLYESGDRHKHARGREYGYPEGDKTNILGPVSIGSNAVEWNDTGSVSKIEGDQESIELGYDERGRLRELVVDSQAASSRSLFSYDWHNVWISRTTERSEGNTTISHVTDDYLCFDEICELRIVGPSGLVLTRTGGDERYYVTDHFGSILAVFTEDPDVDVQKSYFDEWGKNSSDDDVLSEQSAFLGEIPIGRNLYLLGTRAYSADFGIFLSPDPLIGGPNSPRDFWPYTYARNNPVNHMDVTGRSSTSRIHPGWSMMISGTLVVGGAIAFGAFATIPATALGAVLVATNAVGVSAGGVSFVVGGLSFLGSAEQAAELENSVGSIPSSALQFAALPIGIATGTNDGFRQTMEIADGLDVIGGYANARMRSSDTLQATYNLGAWVANKVLTAERAEQSTRDGRGDLGRDHAGIASRAGGRVGASTSRNDNGTGITMIDRNSGEVKSRSDGFEDHEIGGRQDSDDGADGPRIDPLD